MSGRWWDWREYGLGWDWVDEDGILWMRMGLCGLWWDCEDEDGNEESEDGIEESEDYDGF